MNTTETQSGSSLQRVVRARPPVHPFSCPTADCRSEWRDKELWWIINGKPVSDAALRSWCYAHLEYPWCYVDVVRAYHVNAWAYDKCPNTKLTDAWAKTP